MQGGMKREWAKPLNPRARGNTPYGNWSGAGQIYNITGIQPGFHYKLATDETIDAQIFRGYEVVDTAKGHPEKFVGHGRLSARHGAVTTTEMKLGKFYLLRAPVHVYATIRKRARDHRNAGMDIPTKSVLSQNPIETQNLLNRGAQYLPKSGEVFFAAPEHGQNGYRVEEIDRGQK